MANPPPVDALTADPVLADEDRTTDRIRTVPRKDEQGIARLMYLLDRTVSGRTFSFRHTRPCER